MKHLLKKSFSLLSMLIAGLIIVGCALQTNLTVEENTSFEDDDTNIVSSHADYATVIVQFERPSATIDAYADVSISINSLDLVYDEERDISLPLRNKSIALDTMSTSNATLISSANVSAGELVGVLLRLDDIELSGDDAEFALELSGDKQIYIPLSLTLDTDTIYIFTLSMDEDQTFQIAAVRQGDRQDVSLTAGFTLTIAANGRVVIDDEDSVTVTTATVLQTQTTDAQFHGSVRLSDQIQNWWDSFSADAQARISALNLRLDTLINQSQDRGVAINAQLQARIDAARANAQARLDNIQADTTQTWSDIQAGFTDSIQQFEDSIDSLEIDMRTQTNTSVNNATGTISTSTGLGSLR